MLNQTARLPEAEFYDIHGQRLNSRRHQARIMYRKSTPVYNKSLDSKNTGNNVGSTVKRHKYIRHL
jgi:hypothetical protein